MGMMYFESYAGMYISDCAPILEFPDPPLYHGVITVWRETLVPLKFGEIDD